VQKFGEQYFAIDVRLTFLRTPGGAEHTRPKLKSGKDRWSLDESGRRLGLEIGSRSDAARSGEKAEREQRRSGEKRGGKPK
jgi:hypothetical protein